jgi:aspartyl-tRNA(Asn)/glutamyl-tRNA(Gln) amidotransferase subunit A
LQAAEQLRDGQLSALELTEACLQRIEESNGGAPSHDGAPEAINAWVRLYPDLAREQARAADERRARDGADTPLLCGIPLAVKDLYGVAGLPLTASSRVLDGNVAERDAVAYKRLRDDGMVLLGHTHTHEFAAGGTTDQVGNPFALDRVAGGSSGGSAAALAARMTPAALGSDTCGSLRSSPPMGVSLWTA